MPTIFVDADACPVKNEVYRVAERHRWPVVLVANSPMRISEEEWIELVVVGKRWDEADDWIIENAQARDVVVTQDILLAERCIKEIQAHPITPHGVAYTRHNIGAAVAGRELMERIREWNGVETGPPPFTKANRSTFLQTLHNVIEQIIREDLE